MTKKEFFSKYGDQIERKYEFLRSEYGDACNVFLSEYKEQMWGDYQQDPDSFEYIYLRG